MLDHFQGRVGIAVAILVILAAAARPASAQVIKVNQGTFVFERGDGDLDISGTRGFRFHAAANITGGFFEAWSQCSSPECPPGAVVNLNAGWGGNDLPGLAKLRGVTYANVGGLDSDSSAAANFEGTVTMPPMSDSASVTVPFSFHGFFAYGLNGPQPVVHNLRGGGLVTLTLRPDVGGGSWVIVRAVFEFGRVEAELRPTGTAPASTRGVSAPLTRGSAPRR